MVEMVCLHVISLMEALQECNSTIFVKVRHFATHTHTHRTPQFFMRTCECFNIFVRLHILPSQLIPMWLPMIQSNLKVSLLNSPQIISFMLYLLILFYLMFPGTQK